MRSFWVVTDGVGRSRLESLPLPFQHVGPAVTDADRARDPEPELAALVRSVQPVRRRDGEVTTGGGRRLVVAAGTAALDAGGMHVDLAPGDVVFVDDVASAGHSLTWGGSALSVEIDVDASWRPAGSVPPPLVEPDAANAPRVDRIRVADEVAHFAPFDAVAPVPPQAADRLSFLCLSPGLSGDWHTEDRPNLVIVLAGGFELEVGGAGGARTFGPGDVCLVQDDHGQGHRTRTHGETRIAVVSLSDGHAWHEGA